MITDAAVAPRNVILNNRVHRNGAQVVSGCVDTLCSEDRKAELAAGQLAC